MMFDDFEGCYHSSISSPSPGVVEVSSSSRKAVFLIWASSLYSSQSSPSWSLSQNSKRLLSMSMASVMACLSGSSSSRMANISSWVSSSSSLVSYCLKVCSSSCSNSCCSPASPASRPAARQSKSRRARYARVFIYYNGLRILVSSCYYRIAMVNSGLLACSHSFSRTVCLFKLIECLLSVAMAAAVVYILALRLRRNRQSSFFVYVSVAMLLTLLFIAAFTIDSDIPILNYLYLYSYNLYFSIIVYKLASKVMQQYQQSQRYPLYLKTTKAGFILYSALVTTALVYRIIKRDIACDQLPFLVANAVNLGAVLVFIVLGVSHVKSQESSYEESLSSAKANNPLPRFRVWILLNCIGQIMVLLQAVVFEVNDCRFSQDQLTDEIFNLAFVFASFHTGIAATLYFFLHSAPNEEEGLVVRKDSTSSAEPPRIEIELVSREADAIRGKMLSL